MLAAPTAMTAASALRLVSQHLNNNIRLDNLTDRRKIDAFNMMTPEEKFVATGFELHIDAIRTEHPRRTHMQLFDSHVPRLLDREYPDPSHLKPNIARYLASKGYLVYIPKDLDQSCNGHMPLFIGGVSWTGELPATVDENLYLIWQPTGAVPEIGASYMPRDEEGPAIAYLEQRIIPMDTGFKDARTKGITMKLIRAMENFEPRVPAGPPMDNTLKSFVISGGQGGDFECLLYNDDHPQETVEVTFSEYGPYPISVNWQYIAEHFYMSEPYNTIGSEWLLYQDDRVEPSCVIVCMPSK